MLEETPIMKIVTVCCLLVAQVNGLTTIPRSHAAKSGTTLNYNRTASLPPNALSVHSQVIGVNSSVIKLEERNETASDSLLKKEIRNLQEKSLVSKCHWAPSALKCTDGSLDLSGIGCTNTSDTLQHTTEPLEKQGTFVSRLLQSGDCSTKSLKSFLCKICRTWEIWSDWTECCVGNETCFFNLIGSIPKNHKARYRNISTECHKNIKSFDFDNSCYMKTEMKRCRIGGRAAVPYLPPGGNPNQERSEASSGLNPPTKIAIFCVAGVAMIALFSFAGTRLVRTMYVNPSGSRRRSSRSSRSSQSRQDNQYLNESFRANGCNDPEESVFLTVDRSRGKQRMPPQVSRLSIIPEEEDAHSTSMQETGNTPNSQSPSRTSKSKSEADDDVNASIDFMDDVINQIEEDENENAAANSTNRNSILETYGWNPEARSRDQNGFQLERLKDTNSAECLAASDLSLASANLLRAALPPDDTSSVMTSSLSEESYSLKDISDSEANNTRLTRDFISLPDISRMTDRIPDVEEMLSDSDISNAADGNMC